MRRGVRCGLETLGLRSTKGRRVRKGFGTRIHKYDRIRPPLHPESASRRIARSVRYRSGYLPSSRRAARSPRRSQCVTVLMNPSTKPRRFPCSRFAPQISGRIRHLTTSCGLPTPTAPLT